MLKDDMIMKTGIIHILDSSMGMPVLSDYEMEMDILRNLQKATR